MSPRSGTRPGPLGQPPTSDGGAHHALSRGAGRRSSNASESSAMTTAAPAYTGAALLAKYTGRRKVLQRAATLSTRMREQVQDVVQMEEEQRLLSLAFRGRQKMGEQQHHQQAQPPESERARGKGGAGAAAGGGGTAATQHADGSDSPTAHPLSGDAPPSPTTAAAAAATAAVDGASTGSLTSSTAGIDTGIGLAIDGGGDVRRLLEQQSQEKSDLLGKMRGLQQAILEMSEEAVADEERLRTKLHYEASTAGVDGIYPEYAATAAVVEASAVSAGAPRPLPSVELTTKVDTIRDMRLTLRDMLDAHQAPFAATYILGSGGSGQQATSAAAPGPTWLDRDATYRPPAPPQVFSTGAFAVTLESLSNSIACIARVADEACIVTTFRSRTDGVNIYQHLDSLHKWMAQTDLCLDTAQRHLRHFQLGETAVMDGGAFELNSLREQTLLLKESLTAQEQKTKTVQEAKTSAQHRLRDITRRCYLWETRLLHRAGVAPEEVVAAAGAATASGLPISPLEDSTGAGSAARPYFATPTTSVEPHMLESVGDGEEGEFKAFSLGRSASPRGRDTPASASKEGQRASIFTPLLEYAEDVAGAGSSSASPASASTLRAFLQSGSPNSFRGSVAVPAPRLASPSSYVLAHQEPTDAALRAMEQRVAHSWYNPYVRKQQLKQRSEEAAAARRQRSVRRHTTMTHTLDRLQDPPRQSTSRAGSRRCTRAEESNQPAMEAVRAPTSNPASIAALDVAATLEAENGSPVPSTRLGPHASIAASSSSAGDNDGGYTGASRAVSYIANSSDTDVSSDGAALEELVAELADVRTLQLMQSLLRSLPSSRRLAPPGLVLDKGHSGDHGDTSRPSLMNSMNMDTTHEDAQRVSTRQSMQRLVRYLATATTKLTPGAPMLASKK